MAGRVSVDRIDPSMALRYWQAAPRTTVFTHPGILSALIAHVHWWLASEAGRPSCLWPVCLDQEGHPTRGEFGYYIGPVDLTPEDPSPRRRLLRSVEVQHALLAALTARYDRLHWSTPPGHHDLRPWQWWSSPERTLTVTPRQTAVLNGLGDLSDEGLLARFSRTRRQEVRLGREGGARLLADAPAARVKSLYLETLTANRARAVAERRLGAVDALYRLVTEGHGFIVACGIGEDATVRAAWIILVGRGRACEVLGASDALWRSRSFNAFGRFHAIVQARQAGADCYDFNGANSLSLGADKHSYGAEADLYFDLSL